MVYTTFDCSVRVGGVDSVNHVLDQQLTRLEEVGMMMMMMMMKGKINKKKIMVVMTFFG